MLTWPPCQVSPLGFYQYVELLQFDFHLEENNLQGPIQGFHLGTHLYLLDLNKNRVYHLYTLPFFVPFYSVQTDSLFQQFQSLYNALSVGI